MAQILEIKPVSIQVRYRGTMVPPNYNIAKIDVSAALAEQFAEAFDLTSKDIHFNQNALGNSYLSFRHFVAAQADLFSYIDVSVGVDQAETVSFNPPTLTGLRQDFAKAWGCLIKVAKPKIAQHYFEVNIDTSAQDNSGSKFLDQFATIQIDAPYKLVGKGVVVDVDPESGGRIHLGLQDSLRTPDGIYLYWNYTIKKMITEIEQLGSLFESAIGYYHQMQPMFRIKVLEVA